MLTVQSQRDIGITLGEPLDGQQLATYSQLTFGSTELNTFETPLCALLFGGIEQNLRGLRILNGRNQDRVLLDDACLLRSDVVEGCLLYTSPSPRD